MTTTDVLRRYAKAVRERRRADPHISEPGLAPVFQTLVNDLLALSPYAGLTVTGEFANKGVGRPDIAITAAGAPPRAFVELKSPTKSSDPTEFKGHDKRQFERFQALANWSLSNFHTFRLYARGDLEGEAGIVPREALAPETGDAKADKLIEKHDSRPFQELFRRLCEGARHAPNPSNARELATYLAHSARLVNAIVADRLEQVTDPKDHLAIVRQEFRDRLYSHPQAGGYRKADFDELFAGAFAQTLAFGLLLVREATGKDVDAHSWRAMPDEHPLMKSTLRVLSQPEIVDVVGIGFEVICDTVNGFSPAVLARTGRRDPILYFYEEFLETFDPQARERYGVFYTPVEVVRFMVGALDRSLRDIGTGGLADRHVNILDPATGTGTFLIAIAERLRDDMTASGVGDGEIALRLRNLAERMFGFELLIGPYAVAHYRLHHALAPPGTSTKLDRVGIYLTDTLARPGTAAPGGALDFVGAGISKEVQEADRIKGKEPVLAIIGNPPYLRLPAAEIESLVGRWMLEMWDDLKAPVRDAGWGNQLNTFPDFYIAFWRWAIWKLFEAENAPKRGVVAFITNRKFLTGKPYAGLRKMLRERFDRIEVVDLRGDHRAGARAGIEDDDGVFNIQVGTAITIATADGSRGDEIAEVHYHDIWSDLVLSRRAKLEWLEARAETGEVSGTVALGRDPLDDMRPVPFMDGALVSLEECFRFKSSGTQTKRDHVVYHPVEEVLRRRIETIVSTGQIGDPRGFNENDAYPLARARDAGFDGQLVKLVAFRPLDRRHHYAGDRWNDRLRPALREVWGEANLCLYAMPSGTRAGPATWCHALLPDYHAFSGRGGYAFPLWDRRQAGDAPNVSTALLEGLEDAYGSPVEPQAIFDAILCLLSASSYTTRFAADLEDVFPHVPFPANEDVLDDAASLGARIREIETFTAAPPARPTPFCRLEDEPSGTLDATWSEDDGGTITLCADDTGRLTHCDPRVWAFSVSGYPVLRRWLQGRAGLPVDLGLVDEVRDICGRILALVDLFDEADHVLEAVLADALDRGALGLDD